MCTAEAPLGLRERSLNLAEKTPELGRPRKPWHLAPQRAGEGCSGRIGRPGERGAQVASAARAGAARPGSDAPTAGLRAFRRVKLNVPCPRGEPCSGSPSRRLQSLGCTARPPARGLSRFPISLRAPDVPGPAHTAGPGNPQNSVYYKWTCSPKNLPRLHGRFLLFLCPNP